MSRREEIESLGVRLGANSNPFVHATMMTLINHPTITVQQALETLALALVQHNDYLMERLLDLAAKAPPAPIVINGDRFEYQPKEKDDV